MSQSNNNGGERGRDALHVVRPCAALQRRRFLRLPTLEKHQAKPLKGAGAPPFDGPAELDSLFFLLPCCET